MHCIDSAGKTNMFMGSERKRFCPTKTGLGTWRLVDAGDGERFRIENIHFSGGKTILLGILVDDNGTLAVREWKAQHGSAQSAWRIVSASGASPCTDTTDNLLIDYSGWNGNELR